MKETMYYCDLCGNHILNDEGVVFNNVMDVSSVDFAEKHAHTECIHQLEMSLKNREEGHPF
jgi:hypothetical protein